MSVSEYPSAKGLRLGPETNLFTGVDETAALASRDSYFSSNPAKLAIYDSNPDLLIRVVYPGDDGTVTRFQGRLGGEWVDYNSVVQGPPGEVAALDGVPIREIPYKTVAGTFAGSNMRVLDDGRILAPPGFSVESGSINMGEVITLSEVSGYLGITNHLNDREYTVVDFYTPDDAQSSPPSIFHLIEAVNEVVAQSIDTTNLPDNPLIFNYTVQNNARSRALKFRTYGAMSNVRIKISLVSNGVVLKYIPSQTSWEEQSGGLSWIVGDNTYDFEDTPLNLQSGDMLRFEIRANVVALKGNVSGVPYFSAMIQRGVFRDVIMDDVYTASNVRDKLASLTGTDKLSGYSLKEVVTKVNGFDGDVTLTNTDVGAAATVHTHTISDVGGLQTALDGKVGVGDPISYSVLTGTPTIPAAQIQSDWTQANTSSLDYIKNKPTTFAPSAHTHVISDVTGLQSALDAKFNNPSGSTLQYLRGDGSLATFPTNISSFFNDSGYLTGITSTQITTALGYVPYSAANPNNYITLVQARNGISLTTSGTSGAATYNSSTGVINVPLYPSGTVTSITAGTGLSGGTITTTGTISMPNVGTPGTYSSVTTDTQGRVTAGTNRNFTSTARSLNSAFQISVVRDVYVSYAVDIACASALLAGQSGTVILEYADNVGISTNVVTVQQASGSAGGVLNLATTSTATLSGIIPTGKFVRLRTVNNTGAPTFTYRTSQEVLL